MDGSRPPECNPPDGDEQKTESCGGPRLRFSAPSLGVVLQQIVINTTSALTAPPLAMAYGSAEAVVIRSYHRIAATAITARGLC